MNKIIIGKRIKFGQIVMSACTVGAIIWDWLHPENPIPAGLLSAVVQVVTGVGQVVIVNKFGITTSAE